ncbi:MAG: ribonuclease, partial [Actinomycetota bacterium]|nr:ribonuclease [Actinomycetota bacterium]
DHEKMFVAAVKLGGAAFGTGSGRSKKEAEQQAAEEAWNAIRQAAEAKLTAAEASLETGTPTGGSGVGHLGGAASATD